MYYVDEGICESGQGTMREVSFLLFFPMGGNVISTHYLHKEKDHFFHTYNCPSTCYCVSSIFCPIENRVNDEG